MKEYKGFSLKDICRRQGALEVLKNPSRMNNTLYYPDGKTKFEPIKRLAKEVKQA